MAGARALPDLVARIRVDSSGVDQAVNSLISGLGRADIAMVGVAAGIGLIVAGGKSMLDIYEKHEVAVKGLKQAVDVHNATLGTQGRVVVDLTKQEDALTIARNSATLAQRAYTTAVRDHGSKSLQASDASIRLQNAEIRLGQAQDTLAAARAKDSAGVKTQAIDYTKLQGQIDDFIKTNRRYISDQSEVVDGNAKLIRSGLSITETQRVMNDAVDLAALKHISLSDAVDILEKAEHGRMKGLIDLGITTNQLTDADGNLLKGLPAVALAMKEVDDKVKGGRDTISDLDQKSNILRNDWQTLSEKGGPVIYTLLDTIVTKATEVYNAFDRIGKDDKLWATISQRLVDMAAGLRYAAQQLGIAPAGGPAAQHMNPQAAADSAAEHLGLPPGTYLPPGSGAPYGFDSRNGYAWSSPGHGNADILPGYPGGGGINIGPLHMQAGGSMIPGRVYTVGESEEETVMMHPGGGATVIPSGKGSRGGDTYHFHQVMVDPASIADQISWSRKTKRI